MRRHRNDIISILECKASFSESRAALAAGAGKFRLGRGEVAIRQSFCDTWDPQGGTQEGLHGELECMAS